MNKGLKIENLSSFFFLPAKEEDKDLNMKLLSLRITNVLNSKTNKSNMMADPPRVPLHEI